MATVSGVFACGKAAFRDKSAAIAGCFCLFIDVLASRPFPQVTVFRQQLSSPYVSQLNANAALAFVKRALNVLTPANRLRIDSSIVVAKRYSCLPAATLRLTLHCHHRRILL